MFLKQLSYRSFLKKLHGLTVRETCMHRKREISLSLSMAQTCARGRNRLSNTLAQYCQVSGPNIIWAYPAHLSQAGPYGPAWIPLQAMHAVSGETRRSDGGGGRRAKAGLPCRRRGRGRREIRGPPPPSSAQAAARAGLSGNGRNHHSLPYGPRAASMGLYGCPQPHEQCSTHFAQPQPQPLACRTDW